jgi:hypothetical protein
MESMYTIPAGASVIVSTLDEINPLHKKVLIPLVIFTMLEFVITDVVINGEFTAGSGTNDVDSIVVLFIVPTVPNTFAVEEGELNVTFV